LLSALPSMIATPRSPGRSPVFDTCWTPRTRPSIGTGRP
jgi:hypothetical protein